MFLTSCFGKFHLAFIYVAGVLSGIWLQSGIIQSTLRGYKNVHLDNLVRNLMKNSTFNEVIAQQKLLPESEVHLAEFKDSHKHHDDDTAAKELFSKVKVLVWVMTMESNHDTKAKAVKNSWGKHCDKLLFVSDVENKELPAITMNTETGRDHLTAKTMRTFDHLYEHYLEKYDWFMKADDDTYVVMENLRYMLSGEDPNNPIFFGHHFKVHVKQGYFSGGGGYVISKEALRRFGKREENLCAKDHGAEDFNFGSCMQELGVATGDSRDSMNRTRFHCLNPQSHIKGNYPGWYYQYDKYNATKGVESISDYAISFHYVSHSDMANMEFFLYHLRPYGITSGLQDLNKHKMEGKIIDT